MSLKQILCLDKLARLRAIYKHNDGLLGCIKQLFLRDNLKIGTLVGVDKFGNRYYENNEYLHGSNRWVEYNEKVWLEYDASQIPAEWHGWMHYATDVPPTKANYPKHRWMIDHIENVSLTEDSYVPYSTTRQKIHSWKPNESPSK